MKRRADEAGTGESGFTLIEVLLTVILLGLLMGALGSAAVVFLRSMGETQARLYVSNSRSFASRYLVGDVQAATTFDTVNYPAPTVPLPAGTTIPTSSVVLAAPGSWATCPSPAQPVATLYGFDVFPAGHHFATEDQLFRIDYAVVADGEDCVLTRTKQAVDWDAATSSVVWVPVETTTVARDLVVDGSAPVVFANPDSANLDKWQVTIRLKPKSSELVDYDYQVWAKRRVDWIIP